jgi:peptidoglycan/xylan/chitin deacetylase (PgdA/CDA1 family)
MNFKIFCLVLSLLALAACTPKANPAVEQVRKTIEDNQESESISEWHASESHPERIFAQWNQELIGGKVTSSMVCDALVAVPALDLTIFEEQIKFEQNAILLRDCQGQLTETLEKYWLEEREKLKELLNKDSKNDPSSVNDTGSKSFSVQARDSANQKRPENRTEFDEVIVKRDTSRGYFTRGAELNNFQVLLTFDDGPHVTYTEVILEALDRVNARALFFHMGSNTKKYPGIVRQVARNHHSIGSHSTTHSCLPMKQRCEEHNGRMLTHEQAISEIRGGHQAIWDVLGWVDPFFRFPYGESSLELKRYLAEKGVGEFYWSIDTQDWKRKSPSQLVIDTMTLLRRARKGNILFHDVQRRTAEALPTVLQLMLTEGYDTVTLQPENLNERTRSRLVDMRNK